MSSGGGGAGGSASLELPAVIGAATALIAGLGALSVTGTLGRLQRNHGVAFALALGLVVLGVGLVAMGTAISPNARKWHGRFAKRQTIQVTGMTFALIGVVVGFAFAIQTASETERPTLDVGLSGEPLQVTGTVSASNLSSSDGLEVRVDGLVDFDHDLDTADSPKVITLSRAFVGPDSDGKATQTLAVRLPHGRYDAIGVTASVGTSDEPCSPSRPGTHVDGGTACISLPLPKRMPRPDLTALWGRRSRSARVVVLKLAGHDLNAGSLPVRTFVLRAVGIRSGRTVPLYRTVVRPPDRDAMSRTIRVAVPLDVSVVCAGATWVRHRRMACPIRPADVSAVELRPVRARRAQPSDTR